MGSAFLTQNSAADIVSSQWEAREAQVDGVDVRGNHEFDLLRACCGDQAGVSAALERELRWDEVFRQAAYHRVLPPLYAALQGRSTMPASIGSAMRARYLRHCQRVMRFSAELAAIIQHLEARQIPAVAQKGPALASVLYGDPAMREFGDLDLLVRPADVPRATRALMELGYEKNLKLSPRQEGAYLRSGYEYVFGRGQERNLVELQWNLLPRFYAIDVDIEELFFRSREHGFETCQARVLSGEDQLIFLCVHAAKHQWAQLGMVRDIATLAGFDLDWEFVLWQAQRLGILRITVISLLLAKAVLGCALPEPVVGLTETNAVRRTLAEVINRWHRMDEIPQESFAYFRLMLMLRERRSDQAKFVWRLASTPSVNEWSKMQIPDSLFVGYRGVRLLRLLRRLAA